VQPVLQGSKAEYPGNSRKEAEIVVESEFALGEVLKLVLDATWILGHAFFHQEELRQGDSLSPLLIIQVAHTHLSDPLHEHLRQC
jgi:hypothetical protein